MRNIASVRQFFSGSMYHCWFFTVIELPDFDMKSLDQSFFTLPALEDVI